MDIRFEGNRVVLCDTPKRPKKITGTRFGAVLNANRWQTPFQAWCEITKAWVKPFEGSKETEAGKVIEDKQLTWFSRLVDVTRPEDVYGKDFFNKTYGDFFSDNKIFGGMWDSLVGTVDNIKGVIECKTTKRVEDWADDIPEYYALQASLYAYLLGVDDVYMVVSFLEEKDYEKPDEYKCSSDNTTYKHFKVSERYPEFEKYIAYCENFWLTSVLTGVSPEFDEKKDKEYLDALRTTVVSADTDLQALVDEAEELYNRIEAVEDSIKADKKRLSEIENMMKDYATQYENTDKAKSVFVGKSMTWTVTQSIRKSVSTDMMKNDGIYDKYLIDSVTYTMRKTKNKE